MISGTHKDCTKCRYCEKICPENSPIADIMELFNELARTKDVDTVREKFDREYRKITGCVNCGRCLPYCPVKINIPSYILAAKEDFE